MTTNIPTIASLPTPQLKALAAAWVRNQPATQRERNAAVKAVDRGGLSITAAREACELAAKAGRTARNSRQTRRNTAHTGAASPRRPQQCKPYLPGPTGTRIPLREKPWRAKGGSDPVVRLDAWRRRELLATFRDTYRTPGVGHGDETILLTTDPAAVGVRQLQYNDWDLYSKNTRYPATVTDTTITAPTTWRTRVQRRSLAVVDGMMTLDAQPLDGAPNGVEIYASVWIIQGRGYSVSLAKGVIARQGRTAYHGADPAKALTGLRRKLAAAEWKATMRTLNIEALMTRIPAEILDRITVSIADAKAAGACEYGIKSWCHAVGIDYDDGVTTLRRVWDGYRQRPATECRATILRVLRRNHALASVAA